MDPFNGDVMQRLQVAVDLVNAQRRGDLGNHGRPFEDHGYRAPATRQDWREVSAMTADLSELLDLVAARRDAAIAVTNHRLSALRVTPQLELRGARTVLHFHTPDATFAQGWAAGITTALAIAWSSGQADRIGRCGARGCHTLFLDRGRNKQRRFCSLRCQNRVKSATYRSRREDAIR